jgi:hypothetical protein
MTARWLVPQLVLYVALIAPAGCTSRQVSCDCAFGYVQVSSAVPVTRIVTTGPACPTQPSCVFPLDGGQCEQFDIVFTAAGICHIAATAADGREATYDETVTLDAAHGCCGNIYYGNAAQISLFPPIDAGMSTTDAGAGDVASDTAASDAATGDARGPDGADGAPSDRNVFDGAPSDRNVFDSAPPDGPTSDALLPASVPLPPDSTGWVDRATTGPTSIQGRWYGFADGFGLDGLPASGTCERIGQHAIEDCSQLTAPPPGSFPNTGGRMCTTGVAARIINLVTVAMPDYNSITGAGIAFNFNLADMTATPLPYNATANQVSGIAFDIDTVPISGLRVQFPTSEASFYPPFWGGFQQVSPVKPGHNEIRWSTVTGPFYDVTAPAFDPTAVYRVEFLVPSSVTAAIPFSFCISNLTALLQ